MKLVFTRRLSQISFILLVGLIPVLDIFRFDSATRELIVFGSAWSLGLKEGFTADQSAGGALHIALRFFLKAILPWLVVLAVFPLLGFLTGRLFCGWLCPEGTLFEYADWLTSRLTGRRSLYAARPNDPENAEGNRLLYGLLALASLVVIPVLGGISLSGYFIAPETIWRQIMTGTPGFGLTAGVAGVSIYMVITSVFVRHSLCKFVCAAGLMQMLFGWVSPVSLRLNMDAARAHDCTNCKKCERACFMNVNPRKNRRDISCVNCGACIDACNEELGAGRGLFHYRAGAACSGPAASRANAKDCAGTESHYRA